jgi:hypothetical protein
MEDLRRRRSLKWALKAVGHLPCGARERVASAKCRRRKESNPGN